MLTPILTTAAILIISSQAFGADLQCNADQSKCVTTSRSLAIGDRVGVFNHSDKLVAVGKVKQMEGQRRKFKIYKNYGQINQGYRVALLGTNIKKIDDVESEYSLYQPYSKYTYGANAGIASLSVGQYLSGAEVSGFAEKRMYKKMKMVLRGSFIEASGELARLRGIYGVETKDLGFSGFGVLPGVSATFLEKRAISLRGEVGPGAMYVSALLNGTEELDEDNGYRSKFADGFNLYGRAAVSLQYNFDAWHAELMSSQSVIKEARVSTIGLGLSKDLP